MGKLKSYINIAMVTAAFVACSSGPKVNELSDTADPQVELSRVDANIISAKNKQIEVLAPDNFEKAVKARDKAIELRATNKDQKKILHSLALAQAYLDRANTVAGLADQVIKGPIEARKDALNAQTEKYFPKEIEKVDKDLMKLTRQFEDNDTSKAESQSGKLEASYRELEMNSIQKEKLGPAKIAMEEALKEGAKKLTPETLAWANERYSQDEKIISSAPHDEEQVNKASADALFSAQRLLKMVRTAKNSTAKNPEDFAKIAEENENANAQSNAEMKNAQADLTKSQNKLSLEYNKNSRLESKAWLDREIEKARSEFSGNEAEVYKQGDKLVLRLKGLSFQNNKSSLEANNFPLMSKVQKVISDIGANQITVEGHTDSVGKKAANEKLSMMRAESVKSYLIANKNIEPEKITAKGVGYARPIATNKTVEGRAQNRRVDIIITTKAEAQAF